MAERTIANQSLQSGDDDSISITSTQESETNEERSYVVDRILAEQDDDEGNKYYLIQWEGYELLASTWEPAENIEGRATIDDWNEHKMHISKGLVEEFDVAAFEEEVERLRLAKEERQERRKAKRESLGLKSSLSGTEDDIPLSALRDKDRQSQLVAESVEKEIETNIKSAEQAWKSKQSTPNEASDAGEEIPKSPINLGAKRRTINLPTQAHVIDTSEESFLEEPDKKALERQNPNRRSRATTGRHARDILNLVSDEESSQSRNESPLGIPQNLMQRKAEDAAPSRPSYRGRAGKKVATIVADSLPHETLPIPGAARGRPYSRTHGRGRGSSRNQDQTSGETFKFTAPNVDGRKARGRRSLANAILNAPTANASKPIEHFKTPSMVRKAELAARALADRAPDIQSIGLLSKPSEYGSDHLRKRTQLLHENSGADQSAQSSAMFIEEDGKSRPPIVIDEKEKLPSKGEAQNQTETVDGNAMTDLCQVHAPDPIIEETPSEARITSQELFADPSTLARVQPVDKAGNTEACDSDLARNTSEGLHPDTGDIFVPAQLTAQLQTTTISAQNKLNQSSKPITKINLKEYKSRRKPDFLGDAVPARVTFNNDDVLPILIGFTELNKTQRDILLQMMTGIEVLNFNQICTAQEFQAQSNCLLGNVSGTGSIITDAEGSVTLEEIAENLRPCFGLMFIHGAFCILMFPARCEEWKFLDSGSAIGHAIRYKIFEPKSSGWSASLHHNWFSAEKISSVYLKRHYLDSLVELTQNLQYQSLLPAYPELPAVHNFYLFFPQEAASSAKYVISWLRACNRDCRIYTNQKSGSWNFFTNNPAFKARVVIIHEDFVSSIFKIPDLAQLINGIAPFFFWCMDDGSSKNLFRSGCLSDGTMPPCEASMIRLFPHGGAVFLTPSFLVTQPRRTFDLLKWFKKKLNYSTQGTWKLVLPYRCREYLLDVALETVSAREMLYTNSSPEQSNDDLDKIAANQNLSLEDCKARFDNYVMLDELLDKDYMIGVPDYWEGDLPDDYESPVIYVDEGTDQNDEKALITWFAGWTMLHLNLFRKFIVVGSTTRKKGLSVPTAHTIGKETDLKKSSAVAALHKRQISRENNNLETTVGRWNRVAFSEVKEPFASPQIPTLEANDKVGAQDGRSMSFHEDEAMDLDSDRVTPPLNLGRQNYDPNDAPRVSERSLQGSRTRHGIDESQPQAILEFIAITGTEAATAKQYLSKYNGDIRTAVQSFRLSSGQSLSPERLPQKDGVDDREDQAAVVSFITDSHTSAQVAEKYLHMAQDDVKRAIALYNESKQDSRSPSVGLSTYDILRQAEGTDMDGHSRTSAISTRSRLDPNFESTMEWYDKLRKNGKGWEHIYVGGWETCFPRLMSGKK